MEKQTMKQKIKQKMKFRCFVIADDYKWHVLTDSIDEFYKAANAYLKVMNTSKKENHYYFKNIFLTKEDFLLYKKQMVHAEKAKPKNTLSILQ